MRLLFLLLLVGLSSCDGGRETSAAATNHAAMPNLEMLTREGCSGTVAMHANLKSALAQMQWQQDVPLVDLESLPAGDTRRSFPTPTLLCNGRDPFGLVAHSAPFAAPT